MSCLQYSGISHGDSVLVMINGGMNLPPMLGGKFYFLSERGDGC